MSEAVLDASVLIAIFNFEHFDQPILDVIKGSVVSAATLCEVLTKVSDFGMSGSQHVSDLLALLDRVEPFTESQAQLAAGLRMATRHAGLSLGDRACLALALQIGAEVYTADRQWSRVDAGCPIHLIR